jgi:Arc/MetJ-type ribon-helix-helix transcriptional regulator
MVLTVNLPEHVQAYIRKQVESGAFESEAAVITDAVEQVMEPEDPWDDEGTREALAQTARGEGEALTPELRHRIREDAKEHLRLGTPVPDDLKY